MIISRTPLRVSFFGGGTDMPSFYKNHGYGAVLSTAIDKYIYVIINKKFDSKIRISYSETEIVDKIKDIKHELVRESLSLLGFTGGLEIVSVSDIPSAGTGLGSSSTYTVGLLNALHAFRGENASAMQLAEEACEVEIERCGKRIGKQDHYIAALGGLQYIKFYSNGSVHSHPVICRYQTKKDLESQLLLVYTNKTRSSSLVLDEQSKNFDTNESAIQSAKKLRCLANTAQVHLTYNTLRTFGLLLNKAWELKKDLASKITDDGINHMYVRALEDGALGGKLLGAGGGGFLLLFAPPEKHKDILPELRHVPFKLEPQGSKIIYIEE